MQVASFDSPKLRVAPQSESRDTTRSSRSRNAGALVAASSSDLPLIRLGTRSESRENARSASSIESRSKSGRSSTSAGPTHRIMFTKVNMERKGLQRAVEKIPTLGGETVDCASQCTVLVCEKLFRTNKLMSSVCRGVPIVTPAWLIASYKQKRFVDTEPYQLQDVDNERRFDFNLRTSLGQ